MSQDESKLHNAVKKYQKAAENLEKELRKRFKKKPDKELWKPLDSLKSRHDIPKLDDAAKELHKNIDKLRGFGAEESKSQWDKLRGILNKFVKGTLPALTNFLIATKDAQAVSEHKVAIAYVAIDSYS
jgi:predicted RNase H-like nuclease (RuvC/YqgF family)